MVIVIVKFRLPQGITEEVLREKFLETAPMYQETTGLIRKNYLSDIESGIGGGVYCFDTMENAKAWFSEDRIAWLGQRYSNPDVKFFASPVLVDNQSGKIEN